PGLTGAQAPSAGQACRASHARTPGRSAPRTSTIGWPAQFGATAREYSSRGRSPSARGRAVPAARRSLRGAQASSAAELLSLPRPDSRASCRRSGRPLSKAFLAQADLLRRSRPSAERPSLEAGELARGQRPFASRVENVLERYGVDDVETIFRALVANRAVHVPGYSSDEMVDRLQRAWDVEPGYSKTAICLLVA